MGRLIYGMNVSLDGFVDTPDHSLDWTLIDEDLHRWWNDQERATSAALYGRRIYEVMSAYSARRRDGSERDSGNA